MRASAMTRRSRALECAGALLAVACAATHAWAHPAIKRWNYDATVIRLGSENSVDLRVGDPIRGVIGFDSTAPFDPYIYYNADDFANITATVENPRTGEEAAYRDVVGIGVGIYDEEEGRNGPGSVDDLIIVYQGMWAPVGWLEQDVMIVFEMIFEAPEAFHGSALPEELNVDDWRSVIIDVDYGVNFPRFVAEVYSLTPVDVPLVPGDFNGDGMVDARDLGVWRYAYGSIDANLAADANLDNRVDGADFLDWQRQLGTTVDGLPGNAVPEPGASALVFLAVLGTGARPAVAALWGKRGFSGRTKVV
jgi:hypothetical protein